MCSLSWREPKLAQRPITATVSVLGPFKVLSRPLLLASKDAKPPSPGSPARSPVAWWKLDETTGTDAADASGHSHLAHVRGATKWAPSGGQAGGALELDGTRNFIDCGDAADFDFRDGLTVSLWIKPREVKSGSQTVVAKGGDTWKLEAAGNDGKLVFSLSGPQATGKDRKKGPRAVSKAAANPAKWHHVVGVYDGQRIALYVDGQLEDSVTANGPAAVNTEPVWLGNNAAARTEFFDGWLDDVRLFRFGLSEQEIKALHQSGGR